MIEYKQDDFLPVSELTNLTELIVKTASIKTLSGIENFFQLNYLLLGNCRRLRSIQDIKILQNVQELSIQLCPKIEDFSAIGFLLLVKKLEIFNCKNVNSIKFIENLRFLKKLELSGNTNVLDGDLTPVKDIEEINYRHRDHYNIKIDR